MESRQSESHRILALDGMRGLSILWVLLGHNLSAHFQSPYRLLDPIFDASFGVRIFFVISGFVITTLLVREKAATGKIAWGSFMLKRLTKLFPTLLLFVLVAAGIDHFYPTGCLAQSYPAALLFAVEFVNTNCFEMGHTWSLSVEEIFYFISVSAVSLFGKVTFRRFLIFFIMLGPFFRVFNYMSTAKHDLFPSLPIMWVSFFPRVDIIGIGALGAVLVFFSESSKEKLLRSLTLGALPLLVIASYLSDIQYYGIPYIGWLRYLTWPFGATLQATAALAVVLVGLYGEKSHPLQRFFTLRPLLFLGKISYSLYLWQQLLAVPNASWFGERWLWPEIFFRITLSIAIGAISFYYVEDPLMKALRRLLKLAPSSFSEIRPKSSPNRSWELKLTRPVDEIRTGFIGPRTTS